MTTILLVDDDPLQASMRMSVLERKFRDVVRVADPGEAFCMVEDPLFARSLRLVIADLRMPGIGALEFVAEIHARLPGVPVLVLGSAREAPADYAAEGVRFLSQPVASDQILNAASQMLAHNGAAGAVR